MGSMDLRTAAAGAIVLALASGAGRAQQTDPPPVTSSPAAPAAGDRTAPANNDVLSVARERYAAAEYGEALAALDTAKPGDRDVVTRASIEQYRALCLLALGRRVEAEQAMEQMFTLDPSYVVDKLDVSPSVAATFREVRRRVLPALVRREYQAGKAAFERKSYKEASAHLRQALALADTVGGSGESGVEDVRTLAQGFLDLATAAIAAAEQPPAPGIGTLPPVPPRPPVVVDPVPLRHDISPMPTQLRQAAGGREGVVELTIDETGRVVDAVMRKPVHPAYDEMLLKAARNWRYRPGTVNGKPVRRTVTVVIQPGQQ